MYTFVLSKQESRGSGAEGVGRVGCGLWAVRDPTRNGVDGSGVQGRAGLMATWQAWHGSMDGNMDGNGSMPAQAKRRNAEGRRTGDL